MYLLKRVHRETWVAVVQQVAIDLPGHIVLLGRLNRPVTSRLAQVVRLLGLVA